MLVTAVAVLAVLAALQLLLVLGVIRRLREHTEQLARISRGELRPGVPGGPMIMAPGGSVGEFSAATIDGATIDRAGVPQPALFAFFSAGCGACRAAATELARYAADVPGGRDHVIAVIGDGDRAAELVELVRQVAHVIIEPEGGPVEAAFDVNGFPTYAYVANGGTVLASGYELGALPLPRAPRAEAAPPLALAPSGRA
jgi:hypothetical protein